MTVRDQILSSFTRFSSELAYDETNFKFYWVHEDASTQTLPKAPGVYCIFSHNDTKLQKVGKADALGGLHGRFLAYTAKKTKRKLKSDATDRLWQQVMTGPLKGQKLSLYYFVTEPITVGKIPFDIGVPIFAQWARSFEQELSRCAKNELLSGPRNQMLLSGQN